MAEEAKKPAAKKPAAKKTAEKPAAKKAADKAAKSGKKLKLTQTGSVIGRIKKQQATLIGLGLNKRHRTSVLEDTPEVRGMIEVVKHLVSVEEAA